ncbi:MAG: hypothetical protein HC905_32040 [Bacteroidales bacterium]|nr:hypothetical protein [Bacteroidales bacterium]
MEGSALIENAGNKILLKLGEVISKQVEMYQEKNRLMEVEDQYNREFLRTIKVKIPEGYTIKNPEDIAKNIQFKRSDGVIYQFVSSYRIENNTLLVDINEFYKEITCPVNQFDQYRKVVNAAADFNKVTLVLEKN